jgi:LEA14-like dessication related protein
MIMVYHIKESGIEKDENEGMIFKSLGKVKPKNKKEIKVKAKVEAQKVKEIAKETAGSKSPMNIYLELMAILGLTIANAIFARPEVEWRKVADLGLIFIGLVAQVIYL